MTFKAWTFNVQHGQGTDGNFDFGRQITAMNNGDLIAVQERSGSETGWDAPMSSAGMSQAIYKANQIGGSDGNAIWYKTATVTVLQTYECQLSIGATSPWDGVPTNVDKCAVGAKVQVEGEQFYFISTHLCQAAGADSNGSLYSSIRVNQATTLLNWINSEMVGLDVLLFGDMNFGPAYLKNPSGFQHDLFTSQGFVDLWRQGITESKSTASWGDRDGNGADMTVDDDTITHDTRRIDYCFLRRVNGAVSLSAINLPDLRATCSVSLTGSPAYCPDTTAGQRWGNSGDFGVRPTDHNPIEVTLTVNPNAPNFVRPTQFSWMPNVSL